MDTTLTPQVLGTILGQLGFSGIFLWLWLRFEKKNEEREKKLLERIDAKDVQIKGDAEKLLNAYNDNIRVQARVKELLRENTKAIEKNTSITNEVYKLFLTQNKKNGNTGS